MSDTTKLILAIVVVVIVVAVIIGFVMNARRRREMEHRRFEAGELRATVEQQAPVLREHDDRASVTSEIAASARSEADVAAEAAERKAAEARRLEEAAAQKDAEAGRLEKHAAGHATAAEEARTSAAALAREADRLDPDVRTDDEGNRLDDSAPEDSASAPFLRDDDEPDLADAENPFAPPSDAHASESSADESSMSGAEEGMGRKETFDRPTDESRDDVSNDDTTTPDTGSTGTASDGSSRTDAAPDSTDLDASDSTDDGSDEPRGSAGVSAMRDEDQRVSVPALDDRDEFITGSGTPSDDPGDHRGQPWATTTGEQPPGSDTEEGADTHSEPVGGGQQTVPAPNSAEFASDRTARRVSDLEEVSDGGYGVGSAAPLGDGAQPLGHEIKASREGGTFLAPGDEGYDDYEPDVWFYDEDAARRSGFRRSGE